MSSINSKSFIFESEFAFSVRTKIKSDQIQILSVYCLLNASNNNNRNNNHLQTLMSSVTESGVRATLFSPDKKILNSKNIEQFIRQIFF